MKNCWRTFALLLTLVCVFLISNNTALADGISLNQALTMVDDTNERILLNDDFSMYDMMSSDFYTHNEGKIVILYRIGPEKEFTISSEPITADYLGTDIEEAKVYLDVKRMKLIPEQHRAKTAAEVGNIIMLESFFTVSSQILEDIYDGDDDPNMLELVGIMMDDTINTASTEEVPAKEERHAYVYKPMFTGVTAVTLYNAQNGTSAIFDVNYFPEAEIRDNPKAADLAEVIYALGDVYNAYACIGDDVDTYTEAVVALLAQELLDPSHKDELLLLFGDVNNDIQNKMIELMWVYAEKVRQADSEHDDLYRLVLKEKSLKGLYFLLNACSYSAVTKSDDAIIRDKDYLGDIDLSTLDVMWHDVDEMMKGIEWDPAWLIFE